MDDGIEIELKPVFHGSQIYSDGGLLLYRDMDKILALSALAGDGLSEEKS